MGPQFWPWWLGALALGGVCAGYFALARRTLGVSGCVNRVLARRETREADFVAQRLAEDKELERALIAATYAEFGATVSVPEAPGKQAARRLPWGAEAAFIAASMAGGLVAALSRGAFGSLDVVDSTFARLLTGGAGAWPLLFAAGILVGFGTQMAGGCTSGHGLNGCARLQPGSLVATASFFGIAILVSLALEGGAR